MSRRIRGASVLSTNVLSRRPRLRLADFLVRMWLLYAFFRTSFPVAVTLKRFRAPLFDFILGISILAPGAFGVSRGYAFLGDVHACVTRGMACLPCANGLNEKYFADTCQVPISLCTG